MLTGQIVKLKGVKGASVGNVLKRLVVRSGEPVIRQAMRRAMKVMGDQFVLGTTIGEASQRAAPLEAQGYRFSYDMLGEGAKTAADADALFRPLHVTRWPSCRKVGWRADLDASRCIDGAAEPVGEAVGDPSALRARQGRAARTPNCAARHRTGEGWLALGLGLTLDAEEQDRLDPSRSVCSGAYSPIRRSDGWSGLGLAVQAYGKRAIPCCAGCAGLAERSGKRIPVRLVKGAYWDSEIKWAQERGLAGLSGLHAQDAHGRVLSRVHAAAAVGPGRRSIRSSPRTMRIRWRRRTPGGGNAHFEFQRLHGMGEALYEDVVGPRASSAAPAASTRRSAGTKTCSPISCGGCWRTARTRRSSTGWRTRKHRSPISSAIPSRRPRLERESGGAVDQLQPSPLAILFGGRAQQHGFAAVGAVGAGRRRRRGRSARSWNGVVRGRPDRRWQGDHGRHGGG